MAVQAQVQTNHVYREKLEWRVKKQCQENHTAAHPQLRRTRWHTPNSSTGKETREREFEAIWATQDPISKAVTEDKQLRIPRKGSTEMPTESLNILYSCKSRNHKPISFLGFWGYLLLLVLETQDLIMQPWLAWNSETHLSLPPKSWA